MRRQIRLQIISRMKQSAAPPPFAVFFPLAALDAIMVGFGWLAVLPTQGSPWTIAQAVEWHEQELLFGFVAAAMAGFLLTALPRWTGRPLLSGAVPAFLVCWIAARVAPAHPWPLAMIRALPAVALAGLAAFHVFRAEDVRNRKIVLLLTLYALSGLVLAGPFSPQQREFAIHAAIAALIGLIAVIAGRVLPALTARFDELCGAPASAPRAEAIEGIVAAVTIAALCGWLVTPEGAVCAFLLLAGGASQCWRMASWVGQRTFASPPLVALYAAYGAVPLGFFLLALHALFPDATPANAGLHVWTIGGFGGMSLAIMESMIRKRCQRAFTPSPGAEAAVALCLGAAAARVFAAFFAEAQAFLVISAMAWSAAFALFLFASGASLYQAAVMRGPEAPRRDPRTENRS